MLRTPAPLIGALGGSQRISSSESHKVKTNLTGCCSCGRVTYQISQELLFTLACHCRDCQRSTGSAFVIHLVVAERDFEISGTTSLSILPTGSGGGREVHFCSECGTSIWCRYFYHKVAVIAVRGGTLDDTNVVRPQAHIFTRSKLSWVELPKDVPAYEEMFVRSEMWPQESIDKYESLPLRASVE